MNSTNEPVLIIPDWEAPSSVYAMTTTRQGGVSQGEYSSLNLASHVGDKPADVQQNRNRLRSALNDEVQIQWLDQVHGARVVKASAGAGTLKADAAFTSDSLIACCVATADCLPILLTNTSGDRVAAVHAGWRGLAAGVLKETVRKFSCSPLEVIAWLGPAIGPCHFEVGNDVRDAYLKTALPETRAALEDCFHRTNKPDKFLANLYALARINLMQSGVTNISGGDFCTYCQPDSFFSFRREGNTGRMVSLIYLRGAPES